MAVVTSLPLVARGCVVGLHQPRDRRREKGVVCAEVSLAMPKSRSLGMPSAVTRTWPA